MRDGVPREEFEEALLGLLRIDDLADIDYRMRLAEDLIAQADFVPDEAAAWHKRFADRLAELQPAAQRAA
jgi:hypothetical protein